VYLAIQLFKLQMCVNEVELSWVYARNSIKTVQDRHPYIFINLAETLKNNNIGEHGNNETLL